MRYTLVVLPLLFMALSCNDENQPTELLVADTPAPTRIVSPTKDTAGPCEDYEFPKPSLIVAGVPIAPRPEAIHWSDPEGGCGITGHPFDTVYYPARSVPVYAGTTVALSFTRQPTKVDASAWTFDLEQLEVEYEPDGVGVKNGRDVRQNSLVALEVQPTTMQDLDLANLPAGDTIIEVGASWPEGTIRWVFRVFVGANK